ncbi:MAG TPA: hypothetical protein VEC37_18195 [Bacillota bacterium]|nr:hypothetical protein [Bacillota bacterium]
MAVRQKTIRNKLFSGLILIMIFTCGATMLSASTLVDPSRFLFTLKPGDRTTGTIKVSNPGNKEAIVNAIVYDWTLNEADKMITSELGTRKDSLKGLIKFNPQNFKLAPGESQIVRFTLTAPANGPAIEHRGIVFFEEKMPKDPKNMGANILTQVGSTIYLGIEGMKMAFNFGKVSVVSKGKTYHGEMTINNSGAGHIRYRIGYKIVNEKGALVNETELPEMVILPEFTRKIAFPLPEKLEPGKYNLLFTLYFVGTNNTANRTIPFTVAQ